MNWDKIRQEMMRYVVAEADRQCLPRRVVDLVLVLAGKGYDRAVYNEMAELAEEMEHYYDRESAG